MAAHHRIAPLGPVYQAGTLSGNPLAVAAGLETIEQLLRPGVYEDLENKGDQVQALLEQHAGAANVPLTSPTDADGLKFRVMSSEVLVAQMEAIGGTPRKWRFPKSTARCRQVL